MDSPKAAKTAEFYDPEMVWDSKKQVWPHFYTRFPPCFLDVYGVTVHIRMKVESEGCILFTAVSPIPTTVMHNRCSINTGEPISLTSEVAQSCWTLCDPMDCSLPGSSLHGILQARILEWAAISSPGDLPDSGIEHRCPALPADTLTSEPPGKPI